MRRTVIPGAVLALLLAFATPASARPLGPEGPDQAYPVDNLLASVDGPMSDIQSEDVRNYNFEEGLYGAIRRMLLEYPERYSSPDMDPEHEIQVAIDAAFHMRPDPPHTHWGDVGHAHYTPDWDHDGAFGDGGGTDPNGVGDWDAYADDHLDTAYFRVPCLDPANPGPVFFRYASGACDTGRRAARPYLLGVARQVEIVNARGLVLRATLWIPPGATGRGCPALGSAAYGSRAAWDRCVASSNLARRRYPGIVMAPGIASIQEHYWWVGMRAAGAGYLGVTYDPAGQGRSEGTTSDLFGATSPNNPEGCRYAGACRDVEDVVRWFAGQRLVALEDTGFRFEDRRDPARNAPNPVLRIVDRTRLGLAGHSMGGASVLSYLRGLAAGAGTDGRPLPGLRAAVSFSYAAPVRSVVPLQFQTSDFDGLPLGITPLQANAGGMGEGLGYSFHKERYDALRAQAERRALSLIVLEGGSHTDFIDQPFIVRTLWALDVAGHYLQAWMDCHVRGRASACRAAAAPYHHLSRSFASEIDLDGGGPGPSRCIRVPDQWSLAQSPQGMAEAITEGPAYDCVVVGGRSP
jgi:hypothetical protein